LFDADPETKELIKRTLEIGHVTYEIQVQLPVCSLSFSIADKIFGSFLLISSSVKQLSEILNSLTAGQIPRYVGTSSSVNKERRLQH
jgi:hypothetical protein